MNIFQPPKAESLNGLLLGYRIYYRELDYDAGSATESKAVRNPSALRAELTRKPVFQMLIPECLYTRRYVHSYLWKERTIMPKVLEII